MRQFLNIRGIRSYVYFFSVFLVICHSSVLREIMLKARVLGMTSGDYAFMNFFMFHGSINGEVGWKMEDKHDQVFFFLHKNENC